MIASLMAIQRAFVGVRRRRFTDATGARRAPTAGMRSWLAMSGLTFLVALAAGCAAPPAVADRRADSTEEPSEPDDDAEDHPAPGPRPPGEPDEAEQEMSTGPLAVVTIDTQQVFFDTAGSRNKKVDFSQVTARTAHIFGLAKTHRIPFFITFEASKTGEHALPQSLLAALPSQAVQIVKTTFAATGQPQFLPAIKASGARRLVVLGAETDVCVMQTVLGLRRAGFEVIAAVDTLFTEEVNNGPALRRMRQAGILQLANTEIETLLATNKATPKPKAAPPPAIVRPLEIGFLLNDVASVSGQSTSSPQMVRLRELLLVSEWFRIPLLAADPAKALAALPSALRNIVTRPVTSLAQRPAQVKQIAIAGGRTGVAQVIAGLAGTETFLVEDALVGGAAGDFEPLYVAGTAVPSTYKTLYYELIQSVSDAQWPSQQWVSDGNKYYDMTMAPETLPQIATP